MKYHIFILSHGSDSSGFNKFWHLIKPHERIRNYDKFSPEMTLTYEGFDTPDAAEKWIEEYGEKNLEYTILPVVKKK